MPERGKVMDRPPTYDELVADFRKNARERVRVSLHEYNGVDCISMRVWFDPGEAQHRPDQMRPSAKGLTLNAKLLPELRAAIVAAEDRAKQLGKLAGK